MKKKIFLFILTFNSVFLFSQNWQWAEKAGGSSDDVGYSIVTDALGNIYVTGSFRNTCTFNTKTVISAGLSDIFIAKYDVNQNILWVKRAGGANEDYCSAIAIDSSGNCYITGYFEGTAIFDTTTLIDVGFGNDIFVAKYNSNGDLIWAKKGGATNEGDDSYGICLDETGNCYITGFFGGTFTFDTTNLVSVGKSDIFILKLDSNGKVIWSKQAGGLDFDASKSITIDKFGNIFVTGWFKNSVTFDTTILTSIGIADIFIAKYNSNGQLLWVKQSTAASSSGGAGGYNIETDNTGNSYLVASFIGTINFDSTQLTGQGEVDICVARYDVNGNLNWAKKAGGNGEDEAINLFSDTLYSYVVGYFSNTAMFDTTTLNSSGGRDIFIAKYDNANGNLITIIKAGGTGNDEANGICNDRSGNIYLTGSFENSVTFGTSSLTSSGGSDIFLSKIMNVPTFIIDITGDKNEEIVYPNPITDKIKTKTPNSKNTTFELYDLSGKLLLQKSFSHFISFAVPHLASGLYIYKIRNENGKTTSGKIIKQ